MQLTWKASESASALYAALCLAEGRAVADPRLADTFAPSVELLLAEFAACGAPAGKMLALVTGLAASGVDDNRQLIQQAILKLVGFGAPVEVMVGRLTGAVAGLKAAFHNAYRATAAADSPPLVDELLVRGQPLVEQWETRGPGLLMQLARSIEDGVLAERADVVLVLPVLGGNGIAYRSVNAVTFEAVLANPHQRLPEAVRLAWLLAQLNLDLPKFADHVSAEHREAVGQLAMVPAVLAAGEYVEWTQFSADAVVQALVAWRLVGGEATEAATTADTLMTWWQTYQEGATPWAVALAALERMLFAAADDRS